MGILSKLFKVNVDEYAPFFPKGSEKANWLIEIKGLKPGDKFTYLGKEMIITKIQKAHKFLASPWGISPFNQDFYLSVNYITDNGEIKSQRFDKFQVLDIFK